VINNELKDKKDIVERRKWKKEFEDTYIFELKNGEISKNMQLASDLIDTDVNTALSVFNGCLMDASLCMKKTYNLNEKEKAGWFDEDCLFVKRWVRLQLEIFRELRTDDSRTDYTQAKKFYNLLQKVKRKNYSRSKTNHLVEVLREPSRFWKELKEMGCGRARLTMSNRIVMDEWLDHFKNILSCESENSANAHITDGDDVQDDELDREISENDVRRDIMSICNGKSCGIDGVLPEMLKCSLNIVVPFLTKLFRKLFNDGIFPDEWSKAIIVPIFKKGDIHNVDNYRGISLLSVVSKCYTKLLNRRLCSWLRNHNVISECQSGFRKNYSTTDQIYNLYSIVQRTISEKGRKLFVAFVDFRKAFDSVRHDKLLECLKEKGVSRKFFVAIKSMYSSMLSCVKINDEYSDLFDCPIGVRQGCILSPTLFSVFINKIAEQMSLHGRHGVQLLPGLMELFILLFADDIALISTSPIGLQNQLNVLQTCCDEMKLMVNTDKTKIMVFRRGGRLAKGMCWYFAKQKIEIVNRYCYLGFVFTPKLSEAIGVRNLAKKGKKALICVLRVLWRYREMSHETFFKIFDMKVKPILLYASEVWGLKRLDSIEKVHLLACKQFLGVPIMTPNKMVYGDLGRYPLFIDSYINTIKYWFRIISMTHDRMPNQSYHMLYAKDQRGGYNWVTNVRHILNQTGFGIVWIQQSVGSVSMFLKMFKTRLIDMYKQEWFGAIHSSERHAEYGSFKSLIEKEKYINLSIDACFRFALAKLRFGMLPLNNNLFRFSNRPECKMCPVCHTTQEDEKHFVKICPLYNDLRSKFLQRFVYLPMNIILELKGMERASMLSKFIVFAIKKKTVSGVIDVNIVYFQNVIVTSLKMTCMLVIVMYVIGCVLLYLFFIHVFICLFFFYYYFFFF
jgi:hypothetical protein